MGDHIHRGQHIHDTVDRIYRDKAVQNLNSRRPEGSTGYGTDIGYPRHQDTWYPTNEEVRLIKEAREKLASRTRQNVDIRTEEGDILEANLVRDETFLVNRLPKNSRLRRRILKDIMRHRRHRRRHMRRHHRRHHRKSLRHSVKSRMRKCLKLMSRSHLSLRPYQKDYCKLCFSTVTLFSLAVGGTTVSATNFYGVPNTGANQGFVLVPLVLTNFIPYEEWFNVCDKFKYFTIYGLAIEIVCVYTENMTRSSSTISSTNTLIEPFIPTRTEPTIMVLWDRSGYSGGTTSSVPTVGVDYDKIMLLPTIKRFNAEGRPTRMVWHLPKYAYGKRMACQISSGVPLPSYTSPIANVCTADANQDPGNLYFYWLDVGDYLNAATTGGGAATVNFQIRGSMVIDVSQQTLSSDQ